MSVIQIKKYKTIKDENDNKIQMIKTKDEWNKETRNGTMTWYFATRYKLNDKSKLYKSKLFALKRDAEEHERIFLNDPIEYIKIHSKRAKIQINDVKEDKHETSEFLFNEFLIYYAKYVKESTIYCYKSKYNAHLKEILENYDMYKMDFNKTKEIHEKINLLNIKTATKNTIHSTLVEFYEYLVKKNIIEQNYAKNYGAFKQEKNVNQQCEIRFQTLEEFELFISIVDDDFWKLFFTFGFWHGPRKGEQRALFIEDIDFKSELVDFNKTFTRDKNGHETLGTIKNGKDGKIYLYEGCVEELKVHIKKLKLMDGYNQKWFLFGGPIKISKNAVDRKLKYYYNKLKEKFPEKEINELTYHEFARHSHATHLYSLGKDNPNIVQIIAERLRDTPEVIREIYVHNNEVTSNQFIKDLLK